MSERGGRRPDQQPPGAEVSRYLGYGMTWVLSTLLFLYVGTWVDGWLGTDRIFALLGAFIGAAAGFYYMYYHLVVEPRDRDGGDGRPGR